MNWGGVQSGRQLAGVYLTAYAALVIGVVLVVGSQITGIGSVAVPIGGVLFIASQVAMYALAYRLRDAVPLGPNNKSSDRLGLAWNRLALGRELASAWRVVRSG